MIKEESFYLFSFFMLTFRAKGYIMNIHSKKTYKDKRGNDMTKEEAIELLEKEKAYMLSHGGDRQAEALDMAIKTLKQEAVSRESYDHEYFLRKELSLKVYKLDRILEQADLALDDIKATLRSPNRDDMVDKIEKIVNKYDENVIKFLNSIS